MINSGLNKFIWNNHSSLDFGVVLSSSGAHTTPERDISSVEIPGRNGSLILSNNRYGNTTIPYECVLIPDPKKSYDEQLETVLDWIYSGDNDSYKVLSDSYHTDTYRFARLVDTIEPEKDGGLYRFTINFDCQPQRYYICGDNWLDFSTEALTLINPSNYAAQPKIVISGNTSKTTLSDTLTVDNVSYSFKSWTGQNSLNGKNYLNDIILDAGIMDCYLSDGTPCNRYLLADNTSPDKFIELGKGSHTISHTGNCTVIIQPRWWTI